MKHWIGALRPFTCSRMKVGLKEEEKFCRNIIIYGFAGQIIPQK
jgi:hypothetical protein